MWGRGEGGGEGGGEWWQIKHLIWTNITIRTSIPLLKIKAETVSRKTYRQNYFMVTNNTSVHNNITYIYVQIFYDGDVSHRNYFYI